MQNQLATPITSPSVELEITRHFQTYFVQVCELLIDSDPDELYSILDNNLTLIEQFISDQNVYTIFVQKIKSEDEELTDQENEPKKQAPTEVVPQYICSLNVTFRDGASGVVFIKRDPKTFSDEVQQVQKNGKRKITSMLQTVEINDQTNPFQFLHSYISNTFEPYFTSFEKLKSKDEKGSSPVQSVTENLHSLKLALDKCQQSFQIPEIDVLSYVHPIIRELVRKEGSKLDDNQYVGDKISELKNDTNFLIDVSNKITKCVSEISKLTKRAESSTVNSTVEEINFWSALERALNNVDASLKTKEIEFTKQLLKTTRRNVAYNQLTTTEIEKALPKSREYNNLLKDFPIHDLLHAKNIGSVYLVMNKMFHQLTKIKNAHQFSNSPSYPLDRALKLLEAMSRDVRDKLLELLKPIQLLYLSYEEFDKVVKVCMDVFGDFHNFATSFTVSVNETLKKKQQNVMSVHLDHILLQKRIQEIRTFRSQHFELHTVIAKVLPTTGRFSANDINALEEVQKAYDEVRGMESKILDLSTEGASAWRVALKSYHDRIEKVESRLIRELVEKLGAAKNASEMFRVFSKFNALFYRPKVRTAIQQYQKQLIEKVADDVRKLEDKFKMQFASSETEKMSHLRDLPSLSGAVIWAKQIEKQLDTFMKRVEDVFGRGWDRIKILRQKDNMWLLNDSLAEFMGLRVEKLQQKMQIGVFAQPLVKSDIKGTALALAFLQLVYWDSRAQWNIMSQESLAALEKAQEKANISDVNVVALAKELLKEEGIGSRHVEEANLRKEGESFRNKLHSNIDVLIENWNRDVVEKIKNIFERMDMGRDIRVIVRGNVFEVTKDKQTGVMNLIVNFPEDLGVLIKEVRNLTSLGMRSRIRSDILHVNLDAETVYPVAVSLTESVKTFTRVLASMDQSIIPLAAKEMNVVYQKLSEGFKYQWSSSLLDKYSKDLYDVVVVFQDKATMILTHHGSIQNALASLRTCSILKPNGFAEHLAQIQQTVDSMNLAEDVDRQQGSNLRPWVSELNKQIEEILLARLKELVEYFTTMYKEATQGVKKELFATIAPFRVEIKMHHLKITTVPTLHQMRTYWYDQFSMCLSWICSNPVIIGDRFDRALIKSSSLQPVQIQTYKYLLSFLPQELLTNAYGAIEKSIETVDQFVSKWLKYQSLWGLNLNELFTKVGGNLKKWLSLLQEIKKARSTMDRTDGEALEQDHGVVVITYKDIYEKINSKYDDAMREILLKFRSELGDSMKKMYSAISQARSKVEATDVETDSKGAFKFLEYYNQIRKRHAKWQEKLGLFQAGEKVLVQNRIPFSDGWIYYDNIEGEWNAFNQIVNRRNESVQGLREELIVSLRKQDRELELKLKEFPEEWKKSKPLNGDIKPEEALSSLALMQAKLKKLTEDAQRVNKSKEALGLETEDTATAALGDYQHELDNLKSVWSSLKELWDDLNALRDIPFNSVNPRTILSKLDSVNTRLNKLESWILQYAAVEHLQSVIRSYNNDMKIIRELRTEAIKERHMQELRKQLGVNWILIELTLGNILDSNIQANLDTYKRIINRAQGELGLEMYLKQVKDAWEGFQLELVNYNNKCFLIKGWDELFAMISDHLKSLSAMHASPFFKAFEEPAVSLENKINKVRIICDAWIDVQRVWVYLEGVFTGNADIKYQLPQETQKFQNVNNEFVSLMRKVQKNPIAFEVINIPNILSTLEKLSDLLTKIQKSLGEYLEKQRNAFPRFYFVGDEDLLEIIGNSEDPEKVQKHLKKMFAGISTLQVEERIITTMVSREGENVQFVTPVSIDKKSIQVWLRDIDNEMRNTLASLTNDATQELAVIYDAETALKDKRDFIDWISKYPAQIVVLCCQIVWTTNVERTFTGKRFGLVEVTNKVGELLSILADAVLLDVAPIQRKKYEHLITELVHQRDVTRKIAKENVSNARDFTWLYNMRFYWDKKKTDITDRLSIQVANATFSYGWEYAGVVDKLVQTPLTDRCYLALTQALHSRLGGSPFGPAGTGKTETVKALGGQMGRFVLVFNCDENFDFRAMGRIFVGLCQCGAWGCFDEFNRLEEKILSAVSQQVQTIQQALRDQRSQIELIGRDVVVSPNTGIFITMNPGYAGRSNLPDNLKQLFRNIAMVKPDKQLIAQVILFSQGFKQAEPLSEKIVLFFDLCIDELSKQSHYDFGLRALKSVLVNAGYLKRLSISESTAPVTDQESSLLLQSVQETMIPKLVGDDVMLLKNLLTDLFPGVNVAHSQLANLRQHVTDICQDKYLVYDDKWVEKLIQLYKIQNLQHGVILVGPSGCGKSSSWRVLLEALERLEGVKGNSYVIDPKALSKEELYGFLDATTREWTDGIFTHVLRKIVDNVRGESQQRHWIIFDGDVDPEWVENLNSVLDDNKLFTLPNGERLAIPPNVRIMFEVKDLKYATLATVSRCGMIWYSKEIVDLNMIIHNQLERMKNVPLDEEDETVTTGSKQSNLLKIQKEAAKIIAPHFDIESGAVGKILNKAAGFAHVMEFDHIRALSTTFALINKSITKVNEYNNQNTDFPFTEDKLESYITKRMVFSLFWGFGSSMNMIDRIDFGKSVMSILDTSSIPLPPISDDLIDYEVDIDGDWVLWRNRVPEVNIESHKVSSSDSVIPTLDTTRHEDLLASWILDHRNVILCGPPGSGKTMILTCVLRSLNNYDACFLNFSSATQPELILKTFDQYCTVMNTSKGLVLQPNQAGRWLVVFCDEINLPANDKYGTQRVVTFMRQIIEHKGYWRASDLQWIRLERIMFVGASNPPTDAGRVPLSERFLRHCPLLFVDFPATESLKQIYGTFNRALLKVVPNLAKYADAATNTMVEFYSESQRHFTPEIQPHYVYSPRELSRWVRAMYEALKPLDTVGVEDLVRLLVHEGLRIFSDRLVLDSDKKWTDEQIDSIALKHFPNVNSDCLQRPLLYSAWIHKNYVSVEKSQLRDLLTQRLRTFAEEELEVKLVLFDSVLDHILRIDRVLKQPLGHLLLVGTSGAGKTVLSRFCAWMNGFSVFQIKAHRNYVLKDFEEDLRKVLKRAGCKGEKICFIFDESNILKPSFLEYMNSLLASGEVPGLFEGDDKTTLINAIKEAVSQMSVMRVDTEDELYQWFVKQVQMNLHIVFTINPANADFKTRSATSPALFNRCVIDWFGDWSQEALFQVGEAFTSDLELFNLASNNRSEDDARNAFVSSIVKAHNIVTSVSKKIEKQSGKRNFVTPRHYLDFIKHFRDLYDEKRQDLQEQQTHINKGLENLTETEEHVSQMQAKLHVQEKELDKKKHLANEKLRIMVENQKVAQNKKQESLELSQQLEVQSQNSLQQLRLADEQLSQVQPMLEKAEKDVGSIKPNHLNELRTLVTPPVMVQKTLEAVVTMLENSQDPNKVVSLTWNDIKRYMAGGGFIKQILNFDKTKLNKKVTQKIQKTYLSTGNLDSKSAYNASQACGPLLDWVISMVHYAEIFEKVAPLKAEAEQLKSEADVIKAKREEMEDIIASLERKILVYTDEYTNLLSETKSIEMEMSQVKAKVERSQSLLKSLSSETVRWREQSKNFSTQMDTVVGDVYWTSAFLTYAGFFDEHYRAVLTNEWLNTLEESLLSYKIDMSLIEFLSKPDQRLEWEANKLPQDNICVENAIMISRFNRYPMVIDPTGQATEFLMNQYKNTKINKTSFLDSGFQKSLETALRFGTPLLIQDAENIDPILNPILNKEVRRIGGRNLVRLGNQDIDLSPTFFMVLTTRDPTHQFDPDICSRVTFVNFTVTPSSLHTQCLNITLQSERPDIEKLRSEQLGLQGEYKLKLRNLEKSLLDELSEAKGNILENENLISTLERLKANAAEIALKVKQSDQVMEQSRTVSELYSPLAQYCSTIYFTMNQLSDLHFLYHFSLTSFFNIVNYILSSAGAAKENPKERVQKLIASLFQTVFTRVSRSLLHEDQLPFALRLAQIKLQGSLHDIPESEVEFFLKSGHISLEPTEPNKLILSPSQTQMIDELSRIPGMNTLKNNLATNEADWIRFANGGEVPVFWQEEESSPRDAFRRLLVMKIFQPDVLTSALPRFVTSVFGPNFLKRVELDLEQVAKEADAYTPLLLASMSGYDASSFVDELTSRLRKHLSSIAMGSAEAYEQADKALTNCMKRGEWILLKNVHLSPQYLTQLEKKLHGLRMENRVDPEFRIFLTSEIHPSLPVNLLRRSTILVFEPPHGIRSHLSQTFANLSASGVDKSPMERGRLVLLVSWFHSVVQERLRYEPLGWSKHYEFNQSDLKWALDTVDKWIDLTANDRSNVQPEHLPWKALHVLLGESIYGGKVDNEFDLQILKSFLEQLLVPQAYENSFSPAPNVPQLIGTRYANFVQWIEKLDHETPEWVGLPNDVRKLTKTKEAADTVRKLLRIQNVYDETIDEEDTIQSFGNAPSWAKSLRIRLVQWLDALPRDLDASLVRLSSSDKHSQIHITSPLYRYFGRELQVSAELLKNIRKDVIELLEVCDGSIKTTNYHRELIDTLTKGIVPRTWRAFNFLETLTVNTYISDFVKRLSQLTSIKDSAGVTGKFTSYALWLGGLLFPEAFLTATRQYIAHKYQYALETLELNVSSDTEDSFQVKDLQMESSQYIDHKITTSQRLSSALPNLRLKWVPRDSSIAKKNTVKIPVYLNESRKTMLCTLSLEYDPDTTSAALLYQRGVAIISWV